MLFHFLMKYKRPLAYAATKSMANVIHDMAVPRRVRPSRLQNLLETRPVSTSTPSIHPREYYTPPAPIEVRGNQYPPEAPIYGAPRAEISRDEPFYQPIPPIWVNRSTRPAAVKANGGLRGSTATKWK